MSNGIIILSTVSDSKSNAAPQIEALLSQGYLIEDPGGTISESTVMCSSSTFFDCWESMWTLSGPKFAIGYGLEKLETGETEDCELRQIVAYTVEIIETIMKSGKLLFLFTTPYVADLILHRMIFGKLTYLKDMKTRSFYTTFCHNDQAITSISHLTRRMYQVDCFNLRTTDEPFTKIEATKFKPRPPATPPPSPALERAAHSQEK
jgi:hypothetical protein